MLYFEPFMGNNGHIISVPPYTYKSWANKIFGASSEPPGYDDNKTLKENLVDMLGRLTTLLKDVSKSIALIWDTMAINNITYVQPVYTVVERSETPLFTGFEPWLSYDASTSTAFLVWCVPNLPSIATRNGSAVTGSDTVMRIEEGADYLTKIQTEISMTISVLRIMKSYY